MKPKARAVSLADLPDACILTALLFLDVQDALRFRRTCRRMNLLLTQSQNDFWLPRLGRDFGLQLQVCALSELCASAGCEPCERTRAGTVCCLAYLLHG